MIVAVALPLMGCAPADVAGTRASDAVISGASVTDPYAGYFSGALSPDGAATGAWGAFGPPRGVAPFALADATVPAGDYSVHVECAGAPAVDIRIDAEDEPSAGRAEPVGSVACPGSLILPLAVTASGYTVELDSRGEPGAYRISVIPAA